MKQKSCTRCSGPAGFCAGRAGTRRTGVGGRRDEDEAHDIAFLDLDTDNWQERLLDIRHRMPVIAFSRSDLKKAVESMRLGAADYLEKPLTAEVLVRSDRPA